MAVKAIAQRFKFAHILRWKDVRNRSKVSFVIPVESNPCKSGKERILSAFSWAKQDYIKLHDTLTTVCEGGFVFFYT